MAWVGVSDLGGSGGSQDAYDEGPNTGHSASSTAPVRLHTGGAASSSSGSRPGRGPGGLGWAEDRQSTHLQPQATGLVFDPHDALHESMQVTLGKQSLLATLTLQQEVVLDGTFRRVSYQLVSMIIRVLPALVIYGGTLSLLICVLFKYRWGVLLSLLLYSVYMFLSSWEIAVFGPWGILMCWIQSRNDWYAMHLRRLEKETGSRKGERDARPDEFSSEARAAGRLAWDDVFHVVMMPTYKTPHEVLANSMRALEQFSLARTNMGVMLAFEEREEGCDQKAADLQQEFEEQFAFIMKAFHPPNLPRHVPGKSSNECWAFFELVKQLQQEHGIDPNDPRVVITVIDDDSELHENYFEALTYHFLEATEGQRYLTMWQPPIAHFKNFLTQPIIVRTASIFTSMHELACLANPIDCHVPFSSYSLSLMLASSVGGWDPDFISEDWHMFAKCSLMTEGRVRCRPIFLPLMNYAPEEDTCLATLKSRWTQATRHALGVSEIVYVVTNVYLGILEVATPLRAITFLWRMLPVLGKFISVHFVVATLAVWPVLSHVLIQVYMWRSWCYIEDLEETCATCCVPVAAASGSGVGEERVILNSWMVYFQQQANAGFAIGMVLGAGFGAFYLQMVRDRVDGDVSEHFFVANPLLLWLAIELETTVLGLFSAVAFASLPEWIAAVRIIFTLKFHHVVAGMVGRGDADGDGAL